MLGSEFLKTLPVNPGKTDARTRLTPRDVLILNAIRAGDHPALSWIPVPVSATVQGKEIHGTVFVTADAVSVGDETDWVRINVGHIAAERIAMHFGAFIVTPKVEDASFLAASVRIDPNLQTPGAQMDDTSAMLKHHRDIEQDRAGRCGLIRPVGKITPSATLKLRGRLQRSANYGLHFLEDPKAPGAGYSPVTNAKIDGRRVRVWQPGPGLAHEDSYTDYSHVVLLMRATMIADGVEMPIEKVAADPRLCWLISTEGPVPLRHPAIAEIDGRPEPKPEPDSHADTEPTIPVVRPAPLFSRTLRLVQPNMTGDDVFALQQIIGAKADRWFGPNTKAKLVTWQAANGLLADGIFGPRSRAKALALIGDKSRPEIVAPNVPVDVILVDASELPIEFTEAANYTRGHVRTAVHWIVLHSAEIQEKPTAAEALAKWCAGPHAPQASWHYAIDNDSITQSVHEERIAWHAPGANGLGVGYEHCGYARQSRGEWLDEYSEQVLWLSARLAARRTGPRWNLPLDNFVNADGLRRGYFEFHAKGKPVPNELRGFTTHHEVTKAKIKPGSHVDPGAHFPLDWYMQRVKEAA